ncbi:hypothetical protein [Sphingopyxis sp.]|jgi:hypothetical protein|uniref:hypothetical protein n=1 Tax=Sphingopyxis sp. TaxID=1908224 RepID=UPI002DED4F17|nr:hypothetical protein [Sphingopyxis sp.]
MRTKTYLMLISAAGAILSPLSAGALEPVSMPGTPVPQRFVIGTKEGSPLDHLPRGVRLATAFGERAVISPDGRKFVFVDHFLGNAFEYDIASRTTRSVTAHTPHLGISRIHYLSDGSYLIVAPRELGASPRETRRTKLELFWLDAQASGPLQPLGQPVFEGVATSRISNRIAWTENTPRDVYPLSPDAQGTATLKVGEVVVENGRARLAGARTLMSRQFNECVLEAQDFLPGDAAVVLPCYNNDGSLVGHKVLSVALADGRVTDYPVPADQYGEVEGVFPDGKRAFVECGNKHTEGLDLCLLELVPRNPRYTRITFAQDFGNYRFSNPTVSPDGKLVAFQFGYASDESGTGRGILLMDFPPAP